MTNNKKQPRELNVYFRFIVIYAYVICIYIHLLWSKIITLFSKQFNVLLFVMLSHVWNWITFRVPKRYISVTLNYLHTHSQQLSVCRYLKSIKRTFTPHQGPAELKQNPSVQLLSHIVSSSSPSERNCFNDWAGVENGAKFMMCKWWLIKFMQCSFSKYHSRVTNKQR